MLYGPVLEKPDCGQLVSLVLMAIMAGADIAMMASALLRHGPKHVAEVLREIRAWMEEHDYESISQMKGSLSQEKCSMPAAFERANYMKVLQGYR